MKRASIRITLFLVGAAMIYGAIHTRHVGGRIEAAAPAEVRGQPSLESLPLDFIKNLGQWDAATKFVARKGGAVASFERDAIRLRIGGDRPASLGLTFEGAAR